jgi:acetyl/propionyl-CoA carboxylase alpha subunit
MKWRVETAGEEYLLDVRTVDGQVRYKLEESGSEAGLALEKTASIEEIMPGVFSIIDGHRSFTVRILAVENGWEAWLGGQRFDLNLSDPRDRRSQGTAIAASGPQEIRAFMPGKVIKVLVAAGDEVRAGASLIVVEAMKMQSEMKAPKDGRITKIHAVEGATVGAGEPLIGIE